MKNILLPIFCIALILTSGCSRAPKEESPSIVETPTEHAADHGADSMVMGAHSSVENIGLGELTGKWWQWANAAQDAIDDTSGTQCRLQQSGAVWFLAGSSSSDKIERKCIIPFGRHIFFPIINYVATTEDDKTRCDDLINQAKEVTDNVKQLRVTLDGLELTDLNDHREASAKCFYLVDGEATSLSASNGYWIMLKPLPKGNHTIKFGGQFDDFTQDISYQIKVE